MPLLKIKYGKLNDEQLMSMIQKNDASAFNELYDRYATKLLNFFYRMLNGNEQKAQDFVQEICLKIVEKPILFNTKEVFSAWIYTVAYNMCKNEYRRLENRKTFVTSDTNEDELFYKEDKNIPLEHKIDMGIIQKAIFDEVNKMDVLRKTTFILRFQSNLSIKEIGQILNCSEGTVKSRLFYTNKYLADKLRCIHPNKLEVR
jgi:RNA polymerase sigma-70 factor (ECF subfamily)